MESRIILSPSIMCGDLVNLEKSINEFCLLYTSDAADE